MRCTKGVKHVLAETMMNVTCRKCPSTELQLPWWLRPALCIMELMFSKSSVAQSACCLLKALKARLLIAATLDCSLFPSLFTPLYYVLSFSSSPLTLSHCSLGKWGGNHESLLGVWKSVCVCACKCAHFCFMGDCVIQPCGLWNLSSGQRKRRAAAARYRQHRAGTLFSVPFLLLLPLGKIQQLHQIQSATPQQTHNAHDSCLWWLRGERGGHKTISGTFM